MNATRELIARYEDCQWRETKFKIIHELSSHFGDTTLANARALEFLFALILKTATTDLPICSAAIEALGRGHDPIAAKFLNQIYLSCDEGLKPVVAGAIGQIPDATLAGLFAQDLKKALDSKKALLARNLILTLGELKHMPAEGLIFDVLERKLLDGVFGIRQAALLSLGKLSRNVSRFERLEQKFSGDLLSFAMYLSVLSQIRFRSQWTLEDYLLKIFSAAPATAAHHRTLPLELNAFKDAEEGIRLFLNEGNFDKILFALAGLQSERVGPLYQALQPLIKTETQRLSFFQSMKAHQGQWVRQFVEDEIKHCDGFSDGEFAGFLEIVSGLMESPCFEKLLGLKLGDVRKMMLINSVVVSGQIHKTNKKEFDGIRKLLIRLLKNESNPKVVSRLFRACGQLEIDEAAIADQAVKKGLLKSDPQSVATYLEKCPQSKMRKIVLENLSEFKADACLESLLRALRGVALETAENEKIKPLVIRALKHRTNNEWIRAALKVVSAHPHAEYYSDCCDQLLNEENCLDAVVALKSINKEESADLLFSCLENKDKAVAGRALDALCSLKGMRAKRIVFDYMKAHSEDLDGVAKVIRSVGMPESGTEYFTGIIDEILKLNPRHLLLDGLIDLKDRIETAAQTTGVRLATRPTESREIKAADQTLSKILSAYAKLDDNVKSALRSAQMPFLHQEFYSGKVDKASSVLEYCKALDMFFEKHLGRNNFFCKLETSLHEFQNVMHGLSLHDEMGTATSVIKALGIEKYFTPESLPLYKMQLMAHAFLSGRIIGDRFKVLDGLRAWGVVLLLFSRSIRSGQQLLKALLPIKGLGDEQTVKIAKRLMQLQDIRNPAAHRETFFEYGSVEAVRDEVFALFNELEGVA